MYMRYFMWNFSGRQNDIQGHGEVENGNWITGFNNLDAKDLEIRKTCRQACKTGVTISFICCHYYWDLSVCFFSVQPGL